MANRQQKERPPVCSTAHNWDGDKIREVVVRLEGRYGRARRIARFDPMEELISCILSQSSSDSSSFPAFTRLRTAFPEWGELAKAQESAVVPLIEKAGLANQKAKSIIGTLRAIYAHSGEYSLEFLRDMPTLEARDWLITLPGVGPKTASIVLCFSFGRETIPVDTHVFRVCKRLGLLGEKVNENRAHDVLMELSPPDLSFRFHLAMIQHGRNCCKAPIPYCETCPITDLCEWFVANHSASGNK